MVKRSLREIAERHCVLYDDISGEILGTTDVTPCGWTFTLGGERVASYVDNELHLILQIASDKFDLDSPETRAYGHNDYQTNTANFRITQQDRQRYIRYPGWWVEWGFGEAEVIARAEMQEDEDSMGWVWRLLSDPEAREREKRHLLSLRCS